MARKLKNLRVTEVSSVDAAANPGAEVLLLKRQGLTQLERFFNRQVDRASEALAKSVNSIIADTMLDKSEQERMIEESTDQAVEYLTRMAGDLALSKNTSDHDPMSFAGLSVDEKRRRRAEMQRVIDELDRELAGTDAKTEPGRVDQARSDLAAAAQGKRYQTPANPIVDLQKFIANVPEIEAMLAEGRMETIRKTDSVRAVAKRDVGAGSSEFSEQEITKLWTDHAVRNRFLYDFPKGASADVCFSLLASKEPMVMKHVQTAKIAAWNDTDAARLGLAKAPLYVREIDPAGGPTVLKRVESAPHLAKSVRDAAPAAGDRASAALNTPMLITTPPRQIGDDAARRTVDNSDPAVAQIQAIIAEHSRAAPWKTPAEVEAYAQAMMAAVAREQDRVRGVKGRVGYPRATV